MLEGNKPPMVNPYLLMLGAIGLGVVGQFMMKSGMNRVGAIDRLSLAMLLRMFSNPFVLLGFASYGLSSVCYLMALSRLDLSVAYPMAGLGYVLVMLISTFVLREPVTALRWMGALFIVAGIWLIGR